MFRLLLLFLRTSFCGHISQNCFQVFCVLGRDRRPRNNWLGRTLIRRTMSKWPGDIHALANRRRVLYRFLTHSCVKRRRRRRARGKFLYDDVFNASARGGKLCTRRFDNLFSVRHGRGLYRRNRHRREWRRSDAVYHEREIHLPPVKANDILLCESRHEYGLQHLGVKWPDAENDGRADVAEDGIAHLLLHLFYILMRDNEIQFVFARF